jgi:hypothetical protein
MRKLITIILILVCSKSFAQVYQLMPQYGYQANRFVFDSTLQIPTTCGVPTLKSVQFVTKRAAIAFDSCNNIFYQYNPKTQAWSQVSGGGGSTDTTSLSNRINLKIDSVKRRIDSVFAYRNGTEVFQFKDSVGSGSTNDTTKVPYTGANKSVNLGPYNLIVDSLTIGRGNNHSLSNNTALGFDALKHTTTGNYNTGVGHQSLHNTSTGQYNTAIGQSSLFTNTNGGQNTAIGLNSLLYNTSGSNNVVVGLDAMQHNTTGGSNTAIGYNAGSHLTNGSTPNTTASNSIYIGRDSKAKLDNQTNEIVIGYNAIGNGSNTTTIGNTSTTANYFTGSVNATTFVKNGGTSSQFLKADGSVDATNYLIDTSSLSSRINLKFNTTDTSSLQQKSLPANSIVGNETYQTANAQSIYFKDTSGTYGGTITWTGTTAPSGATNHTYRWTRIGKLVTLTISVVYATNGTGLTSAVFTLPSDAPNPVQPSGLTSASNGLYASTFIAQQTATGAPLGNAPRALLRNNAANNGFEIIASFTSSTIIQGFINVQYTAQ